MEPFHQHVFVCTQGKPEGVASCSSQGSLRVLQALACIIHEAAEEWFWGREIAAKMLLTG